MNQTMTELETVSLGDLLNMADSGTWGEEAEEGEGSPVLRSTNIVDNQLSLEEPAWRHLSAAHKREKRLEKGDIVVTASSGSTDHIGKCAVYEPESSNERGYYFSNFTIRLRPNAERLDSKWLYYWLISPRGRHEMFRLNNTTTGLRNLNKGAFLSQQIPLPKFDEQKRIAAILDRADAIRRKRADACELARESVRDFFLHQFGDPVLNVKGFDSCPIAEVARIVTGNTPSRDEPENYGDGIEWIKSDNINTPSHYLTQSTERLSEIGERKSRPVPAGSTLVTCIAGSPSCIGNAALADRRVACNQQINAVVPGERLIDRFLYAMILVLKPAIQQLSSKSMKGMVSKGKFETLPVIVPPLAEQKKFAAIFDQIVGMTTKMENAAKESNALFNSLVQRAFKGDL